MSGDLDLCGEALLDVDRMGLCVCLCTSRMMESVTAGDSSGGGGGINAKENGVNPVAVEYG